MSNTNESISSFQNHIMSKILTSDNIVRAIADNKPDFLSDRYQISDEHLPEFGNPSGGKNSRGIIKDNIIFRYALKYNNIFPYLYDTDILENQTVVIFFDVSYDSSSRYGRTKNNLIMPYEIYVNIYCHNNLVVTAYSKSRSVYIAEEITALLTADTIGRNADRSLSDVKQIYNRPQSLLEGRWHGRSMLFTTIGLDSVCKQS